MPEQTLSNADIVDQLSKIIGERDISPETLLDKCKDIKSWDDILEHQKQLKESLHREISIHTALLDYLLSSEQKTLEAHQLAVPASKKVYYTSIIDPITGLYNDRYFQVIVDAELKRAKQFSFPLTLMTLDIDNFGLYMALYGHETGDVTLNETAIVLRKNCRKEDVIFRLGKNRFAAILLNIPKEGAHRLGERLRESIEEHHFKGEEKLPSKKMTISGGIAIYPDDGRNSYTLITASEEALNTAKQSGKNRILEYSAKRRKTPRIEIELEAKYQIEGRKDIKPLLVYTKNLSESGALLTAPQDLPLGGTIILSFQIPGGNQIKAKSETVRISRKEGSKQIILAVKFNDMSPSDLLNIRNFVAQKLSAER